MAIASAATRWDAEAELNLPPGFRFHPTDEELVMHYLCRKVSRLPLPVSIIAELDLYQFNPWDLPERALFGRREWYFFTPRGRKYPNGSRPNRTAGRGYWKATGADKPVALRGAGRAVGIKKALVFYSGKAPHGAKTDWIMHEYRLVDAHRNKGEPKLDEWVLCRLYNKKNNWEKEKATANAEAVAAPCKQGPNADMLSDSNAEAVAAPCKQGPNADMLSDSFHTQDSEIDSVFGDMTAAEGMWSDDNVLVKEENDWFMDLNLDDPRTSCVGLGAVTSTASGQDSFYLPSLGSPMMRMWQTSLSPF